MQLLMLGLNHKTAPVDVRERFSLSKGAVRQGLMNMSEYEGIAELVVLSTCNRSEIYAVVDDAASDEATLKQFLFDLTGNEEDIDEYLESVVQPNNMVRVYGKIDSEQYETDSGKTVYNKILCAEKVVKIRFNKDTQQYEEVI